jgi:hypothetical protein
MIPNRLNHQLKTIKIKIKLIETVVSSFTSVVYIERIYKKKKKKLLIYLSGLNLITRSFW